MISFNIIGAGRLGKVLAFSIMQANLGLLFGVCNRSLSSAEDAVRSIGAGKAYNLKNLPLVDITFITTDDDTIPQIVNELKSNNASLDKSVVVHLSGVLSSAVLFPLKTLGCEVASIHPLKPFSQNTHHENLFCNCNCAMEGDNEAIKVIKPLFKRLGARVFEIDPAKKSHYHAAAVMASNYTVTLANSALSLFTQSGLSCKDAKEVIMSLMQGSLDNIRHCHDMKEALTGPLARGDKATIVQHLAAIDDEALNQLYKAAGIATLPLTSLKEETMNTLQTMLANDNT